MLADFKLRNHLKLLLYMFQSALPNVDSILYLDTDILVHGNLAEVWQTWNLMNNMQIIGMGPDFPDFNEERANGKS